MEARVGVSLTSVLATYHKDFGGRVHVEKRVRPHCTTLWVTANCSGACKLPVSADSNRARIDHAVVYQILCVSKKLLHSATVNATGFRIGSAELCQRHCYTSMLSASSNSIPRQKASSVADESRHGAQSRWMGLYHSNHGYCALSLCADAPICTL